MKKKMKKVKRKNKKVSLGKSLTVIQKRKKKTIFPKFLRLLEVVKKLRKKNQKKKLKRKREKKQVVFLIKVLLNSMMMKMVQESLSQNTMHITMKNNSFQKQTL